MKREAMTPLWKKQQYGLVGNHSAVKLCTWLKKSLREEGVCYKESFYGIESHRCLQCTPTLGFCNHHCKFCWRSIEYTEGSSMDGVKFDEPEQLINGMIGAQRTLLTGFGGNPKTPKWKYEEAKNPTNMAISLSGEPTLYPILSGLIEEGLKKKMSVFLVTNGTHPEVLEKLDPLPTQLYLTLPAPDFVTYKKTCQPKASQAKKLWANILKTMELMDSLDTRKVVRLTIAKGLNLINPEGYAEILKDRKVHFIEPKAFMAVGFARKRLGLPAMPSHEEVLSFGDAIATSLNYRIIDERTESRVCLIAEKDYAWRRNLRKIHKK